MYQMNKKPQLSLINTLQYYIVLTKSSSSIITFTQYFKWSALVKLYLLNEMKYTTFCNKHFIYNTTYKLVSVTLTESSVATFLKDREQCYWN